MKFRDCPCVECRPSGAFRGLGFAVLFVGGIGLLGWTFASIAFELFKKL